MSIPEVPQPDAVPTTTISESTPPPPGPAPSGLAILAIVVGGVAFLTGLAPVWGLIAGVAAIALGLFALVRKQRTGLALAGVILGAIAGLTSLITTVALIGGLAGAREPNDALAPVPTASSASPLPAATKKPTATPVPSATPTPTPTVAPAPPKPVESVSQVNAKRKAQSYLNYTAFSRSGLIDQLVYEGFSAEDATYGADAVGADWSQQAALKAQSYLEYSAFSRSGLIDQLVYEGFSAEEAEFGVTAVGL
jgi:hypothetical protein